MAHRIHVTQLIGMVSVLVRKPHVGIAVERGALRVEQSLHQSTKIALGLVAIHGGLLVVLSSQGHVAQTAGIQWDAHRVPQEALDAKQVAMVMDLMAAHSGETANQLSGCKGQLLKQPGGYEQTTEVATNTACVQCQPQVTERI